MHTVVIPNCRALECLVTCRSREDHVLVPAPVIRAQIYALKPTGVEYLIEITQTNSTEEAMADIVALVGNAEALGRMSYNADTMVEVMTACRLSSPHIVDVDDLNFYRVHADAIKDDLILILENLAEGVRSNRATELRIMHLVVAYLELYGRTFAISEHHDLGHLDIALEYL